MDDLISKLNNLLQSMWRYRWWGLLAAWVVAIAAGVVIYQLPDRYQSAARVFVDTQSMLRPLMTGLAVQPNVDQQVLILSRTLISRPNVEKLITMADLDLGVRSQAEREKLIDELTNALKIRGAGRDNLFTLSYEDTEPGRAQRVVQALLSLFVESGLVGKRQDSDAARRFIDEQIASYETKLSEAENRLKDFRLRNMSLLGDAASGGYLGQIAAVTQQLEQARLELREAETTQAALQRQLSGEEPVLLPPVTPAASTSVPELDGRIEALRKQLDDLLIKYTERHPDVSATRRLLADLEAQRAQTAAEISAVPGLAQFGVINANPVYQQMKLAYSNAEANAASLRTRVGELDARLGHLRSQSQLIPKLEAEEAQLNRDYSVHKRNYDELVARRESASISVDLSTQSGIADFRVIDPPSLPSKPSAPNRILLVPAAGLAALAVGLALMFLLVQLRPTFNDGRTLREVTGLPLLGAIAYIPSPAQVRRRRLNLMLFLLVLLTYFVVLGAAAFALKWMQA